MKKNFLLPMVLLVFSAAMGVLSPGFLEFDELTHFLKARELLQDWRVVLDIWGRPACTGLYGIAAAIGGLVAARLLAVVVTGVTGWGAMHLLEVVPCGDSDRYFARTRQGWVWLLLYAQPMFLLNSFTVMTEMLLACAWVWAAVMVLRGRVRWVGMLVGLGALARPEGVVAVLVWPVMVWMVRGVRVRERVISSVLALGPVVIWWAVGAMVYHNARWMISQFPWQLESQYGRTGALFLVSALVALAVWMWVPVVVGAMRVWREKNWAAVLLLVFPVAAFFLLHGVLGTLGLLGAMSLPRYFIAVSPMVAVLGVVGLERMELRSRRPRMLRKMVIALTILPLLMLVLANQLPVPKSTNERQLDVAMRAFRERDLPRAEWAQRVMAAHPYVYYALDVPMRGFSVETLRNAPAGTYVITDSLLWNREGLPSPEELVAWGYRFDPLVDREIGAVRPTFDLNGSLMSSSGHMGVGLWVKDR